MANPTVARLMFRTMYKTDGKTVRYIAGNSGEIKKLPVVAGDSDIDVRLEEGTFETWKTRTYLVRVEDLCIGATEVLPKRGYKIEEVNDQGKTDRYEVLPEANGRGYEIWDAEGVCINITTKLVSADV